MPSAVGGTYSTCIVSFDPHNIPVNLRGQMSSPSFTDVGALRALIAPEWQSQLKPLSNLSPLRETSTHEKLLQEEQTFQATVRSN